MGKTYIALEDIQKCKKEIQNCFAPLHREVINAFVYYLSQLPSEDIQAVRHGRWVFAGDGIVGCSECEETYEAKMLPRNYCPNCGARLIKDKDKNADI